jgi:hypothetical protein
MNISEIFSPKKFLSKAILLQSWFIDFIRNVQEYLDFIPLLSEFTSHPKKFSFLIEFEFVITLFSWINA